MRKCACGEHIKHISSLEHIHETQIRCVHSSLSDTGILCSLNIWALISIFDWTCIPTAELDGHDLQNGRANQDQSMNLYNLCLRLIILMKCFNSAVCKQLRLLQLDQVMSYMNRHVADFICFYIQSSRISFLFTTLYHIS